MLKKVLALSLLVSTVATGAAMAQSVAPAASGTGVQIPVDQPVTGSTKVDERMQNQQERIDQGVATGTMTAEEAAKSQAQLDKIKAAAAKNEAAHGGQLTEKEQEKLDARLDKHGKKIYERKHDQIMPAGK